ncbi:integration host factor subunit alpha [Klebsiella pneumoniae]|uniref:Integration host factor subunit alpha n=1 Tax=Klebsiella pneumoniae TaxID=573 RepID=A0A378H2B6_KLEPN|nr:integration host factor subunit alpha [Klebsiella pneumoniae]
MCRGIKRAIPGIIEGLNLWRLQKLKMSEYLFDKLGLSKRDAKELVELFFEEIRRALETENRSNSPGSATSIAG